MTVETTLQNMFDEYPNLFSTRADCLDHLFCTIGDGYEWVHGQLVECGTYGDADENDYLNPTTKRACQSAKNIAKRRKEDKELHDLQRENDLEDGLPDIGPYDPDKRHWYPISKHSNQRMELMSQYLKMSLQKNGFLVQEQPTRSMQ